MKSSKYVLLFNLKDVKVTAWDRLNIYLNLYISYP